MPKSNALATTLKHPLTKNRKRAAFAVAAISDLVQMALFPFFIEGAISPWEVALDIVTALAILFIVGFKWRLAFALAVELVPAVDLFPTWTALVMSMPLENSVERPPLPKDVAK